MKPMNLRELEDQHRSLEHEIRRLERRGMHMTPPEIERSLQLKRRRVLAKDRILELRRSSA